MIGYGYNYQPYYPQPGPNPQEMMRQQQAQQMQQAQQQQTNPDERIWVQGEIGAKAYLVAPGCTVDLWDSEAPVIYLKSVSMQGMPSMEKIKLVYEDRPAARNDMETRLAALEERIARIEGVKEDDENG